MVLPCASNVAAYDTLSLELRMISLSDFSANVGGVDALGRILNVSAFVVEQWIVAADVPADYHLSLWKLAVVCQIDWAPPTCEHFVLRSRVVDNLSRSGTGRLDSRV